jgi:hypothetical protein
MFGWLVPVASWCTEQVSLGVTQIGVATFFQAVIDGCDDSSLLRR